MSEEARRERESWWVLRAQSGDAEALNSLLESVQRPLFRYIVSLTKDTHGAEDVLQETFIRLYRKLGFVRDPQVFRAWTYRIATREAFRYLRRERQWTEQVRDDAVLQTIPAADLSRDEFTRDALERLPHLVADLSPAARAVVVLYYSHELSLGEVAAALEIPIGTVKSRLAYALASLRRRMKEEAQERKE